MIQSACELSETVPERTVCVALGVSRSTLRRRKRPKITEHAASAQPRKRLVRALSDDERAGVLMELRSERFADLAVPQVHAQLLDEGRYLCSESTMYRLLRGQRRGPRAPHARQASRVPQARAARDRAA